MKQFFRVVKCGEAFTVKSEKSESGVLNKRNVVLQIEPGSMVPNGQFLEEMSVGAQEAIQGLALSSETVTISDDDYDQSYAKDNNPSPYITLAKAQEIALAQAHVAASEAVFEDKEFDHDDGTPVFELEFTAGGNKYEYDVHAVTGKIIKFDKDNSAAEQFKLDHGYDESKPESELDIEDMKQAAKFRGGECLSDSMTKGDMATKLKWKCGHCGAEFEASPALILLGGHWCPECCMPAPWHFDELAKHIPFFAQVWYDTHDPSENCYYDADCYKDILEAEKNEKK